MMLARLAAEAGLPAGVLNIIHGAHDSVKQKMQSSVPMRRYGEADEVAKLALFLASDESSYCSGTTFSVDGGMSAS